MSTALFHWYSRHLTRSPLMTNVASGSAVLLTGDCIAQMIEKNRGLRSQHDPVRSLVMFSWAGEITGTAFP